MPDDASANFKPTRWSLVIQTQGQGEAASRAWDELCRTYWFPLYAWSRRFGATPQDAEDYVQGFFVEVLHKQLFAAANPELGKLRTFLLTAFRRHVHDQQRAANRQRRGGGQVIVFTDAESWYEVEQVEGESADHMFDRQWALTLLEQALGRIEQHLVSRQRGHEFAAMKPFLTGEADSSAYESTGRQLGMNAGTVKVAVHRLRTRFRDALRQEIAETQPDGSSVDEEMTYLMQVLREA